MLPRGHCLVAQIGIAREDAFRLLVGVLREVPQHDDDLVLHVKRGVAVVPEVLRLWHDDAVAGEYDWSADLAIVGEGERDDVFCGVEGRGPDDRARSAIATAGSEREGDEHIAVSRQRLGAHAR